VLTGVCFSRWVSVPCPVRQRLASAAAPCCWLSLRAEPGGPRRDARRIRFLGAGTSARVPIRISCMAASLVRGCCSGGCRDDRPSGCASWGAAIASNSAWFSAPIFWADRCVACFVGLLGASRPHGPDGRALLLAHPIWCRGWGAGGAVFSALGWSGRRKRFMGLAESIDAEDKAMGWDRLEALGSVGGLAGSLGMGFAGPAGRTVLRVCPCSGVALGCRSVFSLRRPRFPGGSYAGRCQLAIAPGLKQPR